MRVLSVWVIRASWNPDVACEVVQLGNVTIARQVARLAGDHAEAHTAKATNEVRADAVDEEHCDFHTTDIAVSGRVLAGAA